MSSSSYGFLHQIELFNDLSQDQFNDLIRTLRPQQYQLGELIFRQGDEGLAAYVVQSGSVEVFLSEGAHSTTLRRFQAGEVFGELALIDGAPRSAAARALTPCELLCLDKREFDQLRVALRPAAFHVLRKLSNTLCTRIRETNGQIEELIVTGRKEMKGSATVMSARIEGSRQTSSKSLFARLGSIFKR